MKACLAVSHKQTGALGTLTAGYGNKTGIIGKISDVWNATGSLRNSSAGDTITIEVSTDRKDLIIRSDEVWQIEMRGDCSFQRIEL
jgi:hypothetical protein